MPENSENTLYGSKLGCEQHFMLALNLLCMHTEKKKKLSQQFYMINQVVKIENKTNRLIKTIVSSSTNYY